MNVNKIEHPVRLDILLLLLLKCALQIFTPRCAWPSGNSWATVNKSAHIELSIDGAF